MKEFAWCLVVVRDALIFPPTTVTLRFFIEPANKSAQQKCADQTWAMDAQHIAKKKPPKSSDKYKSSARITQLLSIHKTTPMKSIAFFTNKGGVGKTTLTCNLAAYLAAYEKKKILIVDADPQTNATQYMFKDSVLKEIYDKKSAFTVYSMARPLSQGKGFSTANEFRESNSFKLDVLLGDPRLALIEDTLASDWNSGGVRGIRTTYMFREFLSKCEAYDYVFFDMGPSLGSINRAVLIACDYFILPLSMDIFSIRATENISTWLREWKRRLELQIKALPDAEETEIADLNFRLRLLGYVNQQYTAKRDASGERRAVKAYEKIMSEVPQAIERTLMKDQTEPAGLDYQLGSIPNLHSLIPMSQNSRKPVFDLKKADGIVGAHFIKVKESLDLFESIAVNFNHNIGVLNDFLA